MQRHDRDHYSKDTEITMGFKKAIRLTQMAAVTFLTAAIAVSCSNKLKKINADEISEAPTQVVLDMDAAQTENGLVQLRLKAARMERYDSEDGNSRELFPEGFMVLAYNEEGLLETRIVSNEARHTVEGENEQWAAYGDVVINNYLNGQRIETDTLYWDRERKRIYTDTGCLVRLYSPDGFMQGYGLDSDERARDAQLLRPFDSYGIISDDSTGTGYVDTVNFIGPNFKR